MIGLDAANLDTITLLSENNRLPNISKLMETGKKISIKSTSEYLAGSPWPTFYTGTNPGNHGLYHSIQWNSQEMKNLRVNKTWIDPKPFWQELDENGPKSLIIDVPMVLSSRPFNGCEVLSWGSHDRLTEPQTYPVDLIDDIKEKFALPHPLEEWGPMSFKEAKNMSDKIQKITYQQKKLVQYLMRNFEWDLLLTVFGALHAGGHKFWDNTCLWNNAEDKTNTKIREHYYKLYEFLDNVIGEIESEIDNETIFILFSLHGMVVNNSKNIILKKLIDNIMENKIHNKKSIKEYIPLKWKYKITRNIPDYFIKKLTGNKNEEKKDWLKEPLIIQNADQQGYLKVNLVKRESQGIINPGSEYEYLVEKIKTELKKYYDQDNNSLVAEIKESSEIYKGKNIRLLPDIIIKWEKTPVTKIRYIYSEKYGRIKFPTPGISQDGRSGNHNSKGFMIINNLNRNLVKNTIELVDIVPSLYRVYGLSITNRFEGESFVR